MEIETRLLHFMPDGNITGYKFVDDMLGGRMSEVLNGPIWSEIFIKRANARNDELSMLELLQKRVDDFTTNLSEYRQMEILCFGIANIMTFIHNNWTGPHKESKILDRLSEWSGLPLEECKSFVTESLLLDGEGLSTVAENLELLLIARVIFRSNLPSLPSCKWWLMRCLVIHQQMLDQPSQKIHEQIQEMGNALKNVYTVNEYPYGIGEFSTTEVRAFLHLELAQAFLQYSQISMSESEMKYAFELIGMEVSFIGAMGKRTFFQQRELPQLTIDIRIQGKSASYEPEFDFEPCTTIPDNIPLNDEVTSDEIMFSNPLTRFPNLTAVEQAALLSLFVYLQKTRPKDEMQNEELNPYLSCLLSQPKFWSFQASALRLRSLLEKSSSRRADRALKQLETLIESIRGDVPPVHHRLQHVFCSYLPPRWEIEADVANILISLGAISSALDVFLRLKMWEQVVSCYNFLKLKHKAAEVIRQEMEKKETVKLWCLLGDATDDVNCYEKAWEMSGKKSAQAQRHWANFLFERREYGASIPHFEASLAINSIQLQLWFRLGFAALLNEEWSLCATAYRRYCSLEPDTFEAWNNLGKAYVKQGQKTRAFQSLKEAVRCNYENWKVWDNLMAVSTDCGAFDQVINCYNRILDLKKTVHNDIEVIRILIDAIEKDTPDCNGVPSSRLQEKAESLLTRLFTPAQDSPEFYKLFARLLSFSEDEQNYKKPRLEDNSDSEDDLDTRYDRNDCDDEVCVRECIRRAIRVQADTKWSSSPEKCIELIKLAKEFADVSIKDSKKNGLSLCRKKNHLAAARFTLKGVISKIKRDQSDVTTGQVMEQLAEHVGHLMEYITMLETRLSELGDKS